MKKIQIWADKLKRKIQIYFDINFLLASHEHQHTVNRQMYIKIDSLNRQCTQAEKVIRDRTDLHVDVGFHGPSQVILIGKYKNIDMVKCYHIDKEEFYGLVDHLKEANKYAKVKHVDAPIGYSRMLKSEIERF